MLGEQVCVAAKTCSSIKQSCTIGNNKELYIIVFEISWSLLLYIIFLAKRCTKSRIYKKYYAGRFLDL